MINYKIFMVTAAQMATVMTTIMTQCIVKSKHRDVIIVKVNQRILVTHGSCQCFYVRRSSFLIIIIVLYYIFNGISVSHFAG